MKYPIVGYLKSSNDPKATSASLSDTSRDNINNTQRNTFQSQNQETYNKNSSIEGSDPKQS
jgi:hypothetical protein